MRKVITKAASDNYYSSENRARRRKQRRVRKVIRDCVSIILVVLIIAFIVTSFMDNSNVSGKDTENVSTEDAQSSVGTYETEEEFLARIYLEDGCRYTAEYYDPDYDPELEAAVQKMLDEMNGEQPILSAEDVLPAIETLPSVSKVTWSEDDYKYMVMVLTGECQTFSYEDQLKVGSVVLNRVNCTKYFKDQNTIKDVCLAPGQYTCFNEGGPAYRTPTETTIKAALYLLENGSILPSNVLFQAQFKQGDGVYEQIDNTYLCYKD